MRVIAIGCLDIMIKPLSPLDSVMPEKQMLQGLSRFQRILLVTDGTVTALVEQYLEEKINIVKLAEHLSPVFADINPAHQTFVEAYAGRFFDRTVLLQGHKTKKNWIYAESTILIDHLATGFRDDLLAFREPIGRLWEKYRCETYKCMLRFEQRQAGPMLAEYFDVPVETTVTSRTYSVLSNANVIMVITEVFPNTFFCE